MGAFRAAALATEFGFTVCGSIVGGIFLGRYLDDRLGTSPLLFLLGLVGGFAFSIYLIYVIYRVQIQPRRRAASAAGAESDPLLQTTTARASHTASEHADHDEPAEHAATSEEQR